MTYDLLRSSNSRLKNDKIPSSVYTSISVSMDMDTGPHLRADKLASQHPVQRRYILHIATLGWPVQWPSLPSPTLQSCVITLQSSPMKGYKSNQINGRIVIKERVGLDISPHPHEISKLLIPLLLVF